MFQVSWQDTFDGSYDWHSLVRTNLFKFTKLVWAGTKRGSEDIITTFFFLKGGWTGEPHTLANTLNSSAAVWVVNGNFDDIVSSMLPSFLYSSLTTLHCLNFRDPCVLSSSEVWHHSMLMEVTTICFSSAGSKVFPNQMIAVIQRGSEEKQYPFACTYS